MTMALLDQQTVTVAEVIEPTAPPSTPVLLYPENGAIGVSTALTFLWSAIGGTEHEIQVALDPSFTELELTQAGILEPSLYVSGLLPNTEHFWRIRSSNPYGTSSWSATWGFTTGAEPTPPDTTMESIIGLMMMVMVVGMVTQQGAEGIGGLT